MSSIDILRPLWLLFALVTLVIFIAPAGRRLPGSWSAFVEPTMQSYLTKFLPATKASRARWVRWTVCVLASAALAGVSFGYSAQPPLRDLHGRYIVVDVGASAPITPMVFTARKLTASAVDMPTGLIAVGNDAFDVVPMTNDPAQLDRYLSVLNPSLMPEKGRRLARGIVRAQAAMVRTALTAQQIVVVSSGNPPPGPDRPLVRPETSLWIVLQQPADNKWREYADAIGASLAQNSNMNAMDAELTEMRDRAVRAAIPVSERRDLTPWLALLCMPCWILLFFRRERRVG